MAFLDELPMPGGVGETARPVRPGRLWRWLVARTLRKTWAGNGDSTGFTGAFTSTDAEMALRLGDLGHKAVGRAGMRF